MVRFGVMIYRETFRQVDTDLIDRDMTKVYRVRYYRYLFIPQLHYDFHETLVLLSSWTPSSLKLY